MDCKLIDDLQYKTLKKTVFKKNLLIIDSNELSSIGVKSIFESAQTFNKILEAENGEKGLEFFKKFKPCLVIIDTSACESNIIELIRRIKKLDESVKIIIMSWENNTDMALDIFCAGAKAYFNKNTTPQKLFNIADTVLKGGIWFEDEIYKDILNIIAKERDNKQCLLIAPKCDNQPLTQREIDVLKLIVDGNNNNQISEKLCVSIHTAKAHVCKILQKLKVVDRTQAAIMAIKDNII